jgi:hypothetical protein
MAIFVTVAFLITNSAILSSAYGCINSTSTNHTNSSSVVKNSSGNLTARPSASTSSSQTLDIAVGPPCVGSTSPLGNGVNSQTNRIYH